MALTTRLPPLPPLPLPPTLRAHSDNEYAEAAGSRMSPAHNEYLCTQYYLPQIIKVRDSLYYWSTCAPSTTCRRSSRYVIRCTI
jgi:hypothetical protein